MSDVDLQREESVLYCLLNGMPNKKIAEKLGATLDQVKQDVSVLLHRYRAKNRVDLVVGRVREGLERIGKTP